MAALALSDRQPLGVTPTHGDDRLRHQRIVNDDIGFHQQAMGAQRQQIFRAWACADQRDVSLRRRVAQEQFGGGLAGLGRMADFHGAGRRAGEEIVPEAPAWIALRQELFCSIAKRVRQHRKRAKRRR